MKCKLKNEKKSSQKKPYACEIKSRSLIKIMNSLIGNLKISESAGMK